MSTRRISTIVLAAASVIGLLVSAAEADIIAYQVPAGTVGTQAFDGPLGMDFNTTDSQWVKVTQLGVFDSAQDGLNRPITAYIYDRITQTAVATLAFSTGSGDTLIDGSRFQALASPLFLPPGFQGSVVAENYGTGELNGNSGAPVWTTDSGGGLLSFVGSSRYGTTQGAYPGSPDGGPANRYAAGTFMFDNPQPQVGGAVPVANPSFEVPAHGPGGFSNAVPGWTPDTGNNAGNYRPTTTQFPTGVPDGNQVLFINGGVMRSDPLGALKPDTLYILEAEWGERADSPGPQHIMSLVAGGTNVAGGTHLGWIGWVNTTTNVGGVDPAPGQFETARGYFTANHNAAPGSPLRIEFGKTSGGQAIYDSVRLRALTGAAVPLVNPSFELTDVASGGWSPTVPGWTPAGPGNKGVYESLSQIVPADLSQVLFIETSGSMTQTLTGVPLEGNHRYFLLVDVADRDSTSFAGYTVELLAGGQVVARDNNSLLVPQFSGQPGQFLATSVIDVFVPDGHPLVGQDLGIRLSALTLGAHAYFDNVRLFSVLVPEPSAMALALLGFVGLAGCAWRRRRP